MPLTYVQVAVMTLIVLGLAAVEVSEKVLEAICPAEQIMPWREYRNIGNGDYFGRALAAHQLSHAIRDEYLTPIGSGAE